MKIRRATMVDLDVAVDVLRGGRNQLVEWDVDQWQGDHPNATHVKEDIENGYAYLVKAGDGQTVGTLAIVEVPNHSYDKLNGEWLINAEDYVVIHRVVIYSRYTGRGYASKLFLSLIKYLETERPKIKSIRLSTNENNMAMQRIATKSGSKKVGILHGAFRPSELSYVYELLTEVCAA